jgi:hypothetical protein
MKGIFIFIGGFVAGVLFTFLTLFFISVATRNNNSKNYVQEEIEVQYFDVKGKKGNVTLHTGISKDSVRILVGKPDEIDLRTILNSTHEDWGYKLKNEYVSDLDINFRDGKLEGVRQN